MRSSLRPTAALIGCMLALLLCAAAPEAAVAAPDWSVTPSDMSLGNPKAAVTVIEYASASCPHCAWFNNEVFPAFKAKYIDTGKVRYVMREFLTDPMEVAAAGFLTARCGGPKTYFTILDQVFRHQAEIYQKGDMDGVLMRAAQVGGVSADQFHACIYDGKTLGDLNERVDTYTNRDGITSTPTFVVNGKMLTPGEKTLAEMDQAIADAAKAR